MQTLRFEAENGRLYHQIESSEIFSNEELVKQGFTKKLNYPFNEILWEKATHGEALELRNTAVKYWKNKLYAVFRKLALKGESKYMVYLNKEFLLLKCPAVFSVPLRLFYSYFNIILK